MPEMAARKPEDATERNYTKSDIEWTGISIARSGTLWTFVKLGSCRACQRTAPTEGYRR